MKRRSILVFTLIGLIFILSSCKDVEEGKIVEEIDHMQKIIDNMTVEEKIGQLMIFGLNGTEVDDHVEKMILENHVGGFILFGHNISNEDQTFKLLNKLKEINTVNKVPLFLSIDEEGGKVSRLPNNFLKLPEAKKIGDINDEKISFEYGKILATRIKSLGFNMNFAPVFDINSNPKNPVIGDRAFGSTAESVVDNGLQVMRGINSENIISIVKHFPGHGDTDVDSHVNIPIVEKSLNELKDIELIPFIKGIDENVDGIMIGHILYPKLDERYPATLSQKIIEELLRKELLYDGVVISDDMTMGAIVKNYSIEEGAARFLTAGGDILLICHGYENQMKVLDRIKKEVEEGDIPQEELDKKVYRILKLKQKYHIQDKLLEDLDIESINSKTRELLKDME